MSLIPRFDCSYIITCHPITHIPGDSLTLGVPKSGGDRVSGVADGRAAQEAVSAVWPA